MAFLILTSGLALAAGPKKPNILVIWGDDIGLWNISAYNMGMMGYKTPNSDRIAIARLIVSFQSLMDLRLSTLEGGPQAR